MRLVNIGYGNAVVAERVVAIISPDSAPMKRFKEEARKAGRLIDGTQGRRTRSILIVDSHHVVLSALATETVAERLERGVQDDGSTDGLAMGNTNGSLGRSVRAQAD